MRVLYFSRDYTSHDYRFLTSLVESGHEAYYLRLERQGHMYEDRSLPPEVHQVQWRGGQQPFTWRSLPALRGSLRRVLREVKPDILHAGPVQTAAFLGALCGFKPLAAVSWGYDLLKDADKNWLYRWITRYTLSRSTVLIGDCEAVREKAVELGFPPERVFAFPWGIDLNTFTPRSEAHPASALRERLGWQDCIVALSLRSWEPIYGIDVLLRGFAEAAAQNENLRLLMLGGGSQAPLVHRIIQENGLENRVHLAGQVNQMALPGIYRAADLYFSASHSDGSSVSLMEAVGSGLPVLITDISGNREWVTEGREGWLFPDGDHRALGSLLLRAANQPETITAMRAAARARAEQRADWNKNFQVLLEGYRKALQLDNKRSA
ncbi:MAG TPA: glycosyltransferase [Erythrobacter sp.]|nr:glycosyltransferase [Erythrobacter sp.]